MPLITANQLVIPKHFSVSNEETLLVFSIAFLKFYFLRVDRVMQVASG